MNQADGELMGEGATPDPLSPATLIRGLVGHRYLLVQLALKTVRSTYGGSIGGVIWLLAKPMLLLAVYTLVFGHVFQSRFFKSQGPVDSLEFALALFCGLTVFTVLADMLGKAPTIITSNANFVKKVVFPLDIFVAAEFAAALIYYAISMSIFVLAMLLSNGYLARSSWWAIPIAVPFFMMTLGVSWALAALGVFLRDISQLTLILINVLMFLSPIFFPVSALPQSIQAWVWLNPVTFVVEATRAAFFLNTSPDLRILGVHAAAGALVMWLGWCFFQKTRRGFADVL